MGRGTTRRVVEGGHGSARSMSPLHHAAHGPPPHRFAAGRQELAFFHDTGYRANRTAGGDRRAQARLGKRMPRPLKLDPDRLFPADPSTRSIARALYGEVAGLPIVSPHGHTDPVWFATDAAWSNPTELLLAPDHYLYRMLYSQGVPLDALGVP